MKKPTKQGTETLTEVKIMQFLEKNYADKIKKHSKRITGRCYQDILYSHAEEFCCLSKAVKEGYQSSGYFCPTVFAICDYSPPRPDRGNTWYSVYYIYPRKIGKKVIYYPSRLYIPAFMSHRKNGIWGFSSGAIGSSRLLDATDHVFTTLEKMGGQYIQIGCI